MEVWNPNHPHNAVWREYTQSLMDNKPKVVECRCNSLWKKSSDPLWYKEAEYRIARPMLKLSYEVPMPVTEPLEDGQKYWIVGSIKEKYPMHWNNSDFDLYWLRAGLIYTAEADAQAAIDARNAAVKAALEGAK